ncbi:MAG TPA: 50S ribosomal protein L17 [Firmicutes bacterium]|nr:50S ribosomal protein L17 [Bacillota bacterium]HBK60028.1 50S ribosomal protein L17 [Bacillota bacterium]
MRQGKLGRTASARRALFRSSVTNLFIHDRIITTESKAKEMRPIAEKLITWARKGDLHHRRLAARYVLEPMALQRLFDEIGPQYAERPGGYTRIVKLGPRRGDAAPLAVIELVDRSRADEKKAKAKK